MFKKSWCAQAGAREVATLHDVDGRRLRMPSKQILTRIRALDQDERMRRIRYVCLANKGKYQVDCLMSISRVKRVFRFPIPFEPFRVLFP